MMMIIVGKYILSVRGSSRWCVVDCIHSRWNEASLDFSIYWDHLSHKHNCIHQHQTTASTDSTRFEYIIRKLHACNNKFVTFSNQHRSPFEIAPTWFFRQCFFCADFGVFDFTDKIAFFIWLSTWSCREMQRAR